MERKVKAINRSEENQFLIYENNTLKFNFSSRVSFRNIYHYLLIAITIVLTTLWFFRFGNFRDVEKHYLRYSSIGFFIVITFFGLNVSNKIYMQSFNRFKWALIIPISYFGFIIYLLFTNEHEKVVNVEQLVHISRFAIPIIILNLFWRIVIAIFEVRTMPIWAKKSILRAIGSGCFLIVMALSYYLYTDNMLPNGKIKGGFSTFNHPLELTIFSMILIFLIAYCSLFVYSAKLFKNTSNSWNKYTINTSVLISTFLGLTIWVAVELASFRTTKWNVIDFSTVIFVALVGLRRLIFAKHELSSMVVSKMIMTFTLFVIWITPFILLQLVDYQLNTIFAFSTSLTATAAILFVWHIKNPYHSKSEQRLITNNAIALMVVSIGFIVLHSYGFESLIESFSLPSLIFTVILLGVLYLFMSSILPWALLQYRISKEIKYSNEHKKKKEKDLKENKIEESNNE